MSIIVRDLKRIYDFCRFITSHNQSLHDSVEHPDLGGRVTIVYVLFLRLSIGSYNLITQKIPKRSNLSFLFCSFFLS